MPKSLSVAVAALFLVVGCVSVSPTVSTAPSAVATAVPSLGVTTPAPQTAAATSATPTSTPTAAATLPAVTPTAIATVPATTEPTIEPTTEPTSEPTALQTEEASASPPTGTTDRDKIFVDDMSDPSSGWVPVSGDVATIGYDTGVLAFRFNENPAWAFTVRNLDTPETTLLGAANFSPQSEGAFGVLCGDSVTATLYGAIVEPSGGLVFVETDHADIKVLERHDDLSLDIRVADDNPMALECHADGSGGLTMIAGLSGTGPVAAYHKDSNAPLSFDSMGLYGESSSDSYTLAVSLATLYGLGGSGDKSSEGAKALFQHIPTDFQNNCWESPQFSDAADYIVTCVPQTSGTGADIERYEQYADQGSMNSAYQDLVNAFGVESTGTCATEPDETTWSIGGQDAGRVQCAPQKVGIRFDWTYDVTSILSSLIDFEGSYSDTYDQWLNAGPIIPQG